MIRFCIYFSTFRPTKQSVRGIKLRLYVSMVLVHTRFRSCRRLFYCLLFPNTVRWRLRRSRSSSLELCDTITFVDSRGPQLLKITFVLSRNRLHNHVRRLSRSPAAVHVRCFLWWSRTGSSSHLRLLGHAGTECTCTRGPSYMYILILAKPHIENFIRFSY